MKITIFLEMRLTKANDLLGNNSGAHKEAFIIKTQSNYNWLAHAWKEVQQRLPLLTTLNLLWRVQCQDMLTELKLHEIIKNWILNEKGKMYIFIDLRSCDKMKIFKALK